MAGTTTPDIINKGLLDLYSARADREKAQLDLQRAMAKEQMLGRTTVPSVFAQLKQKHEKEQAQAQKIKEAGQPTPAAMLPPAVDMTGTPQRSSAAGSAAESISELVSGGGGVKTGAVGGAPGGGLPNMAGVAMGGDLSSAAIGAGVQAAFPQAAQAVQQMTPASAVPQGVPSAPPPQPGSAVTEPVGGVERGLSGLGAILALAGRNPNALVSLGSRAITGKEKTGERVASAQEQAAPFAKGLAAILDQGENPNPLIAKAAQQTMGRYLDKIEAAGGPEVRQTAQLMAFDVQQQMKEARYWKEQDPEYQLKSLTVSAEKTLLDSGLSPEDAVKKGIWTPAQYALWKHSEKGITADIKVMPPAVQADLIKNVVQKSDLMDLLKNVTESYDPSMLDVAGRVEGGLLKVGAWFSALTPEEQQRYAKFKSFGQYTAEMTLDRMTALAGKTMSLHEIKLVKDAIAHMGQDPTQFKVYLDQMRQNVGLSLFRYQHALEMGAKGDPRFTMDLTNTRNLVLQAGNKAYKDYQAQGFSKDEAAQQVSMDLWNNYGIDYPSLQKLGPSLPPSMREKAAPPAPAPAPPPEATQ